MRFGIRTIDELPITGKTVLCRIDINQPVDKATATLKSTNRIRACIPTIRELSDAGARLVLLAHQGSDIEYKNYFSTQPHAAVLEEYLGKPVQWIDDVCGPAARAAIRSLGNGDILLLDNVRFCAEEQTLFETKLCLTHEQQANTQVVRKLAPLADCYVCDAFAAAHRDQPSLCGFEQVLPSAMGRLFEQEYCAVSSLMETPERPCVFILGGSKIADAFVMLNTVLSRGVADTVLTGGLVGNIFLMALGRNIGSESLAFVKANHYDGFLPQAKTLYETYGSKILLPEDIAFVVDGARREAALGNVPVDAAAVDIGSNTVMRYLSNIGEAKTVFVNGPMGIFERSETEFGTQVIWQALAEASAFTVVGGGDSITAAEKYGVTGQLGYLCTGGGALIRFLSGEELPVVKALRHGSLIPYEG